MFETREFRGWWWLPGERENRLPGTLHVVRGVSKLDLTDHFGDEIIGETEEGLLGTGRLAGQPRILGLDGDGELITTEGDAGSSDKMHSAGVVLSEYQRRVTLVGKHFGKREKIGFDEISIVASDLTAWTGIKAIETKGRFRTPRGATYSVWSGASARWRPVDDVEIELARGERAFIHFGATFTGIDWISQRSDDASITQRTELRLRFRRRRSLEEVFERVGQIRNFLRLAVGRPIAILSVTGYQDDYTEGKSKRALPIEIIWEIPHNPDPPARPRSAHEMLFTLPQASPDISSVMRSWFAKQARLKPVFNLYFGTRYHPDLFLDVRFLLFAQAIESYGYLRHRKVVRRDFAVNVKDVLSNCRTVSRKIVGDESTFLPHLTVTRNYYTHYDPKKEKRAAKGAALYLLTTQLQALIEMSLLRELGFSTRSIDATLERVDRYREIEHFREYAAKEAAR